MSAGRGHPADVRPGGRRTLLRLTLAATLTVAALVPLGGLSAAPARADDVTGSVDPARTGWDAAEPDLAPSQVTASDFGRQFSTQLDGSVYAQPLVVGGTVVAVTEKATAYGVDARTGAVRWSRHFGAPFQSSAIGCGDLTPDLGSTSTPVYDAASGTVYLTTKLADGAAVNQPHWYLQAIDLATGAERPGYPLLLQGTADNDPAVTFDAFVEHQRPGLLLAGGMVFMAFGSHCDIGDWRGWVLAAAVGASPHLQSAWTTEVANGSGAGVWQAGGGIVGDGVDAAGHPRLLISTGNGISPPIGPGDRPPGLLGDAVVRLGLDAGGHLAAQDFFAPANAPALDQGDTDLGSGGPVALPDSFGTATHPHLLVEAGKDGRVFLLDRDHLGGRGQRSGGGDAAVQVLGPYHGVWGHPAVYGGEGGWVYLVENGGPLRAYRRSTTAAGDPALAAVGASAATFGYTSGSPVVTSSGTTPGSALVWVVSSSGATGQNAQLQAYDAVPAAGVLKLRWSASIGVAVKFAVAATTGGRVYIATRDGTLQAFGRPAAATLTAPPADFGYVGVGSAPATSTVTFTAHQAVTVTGVSTSTPFAVDAVALHLPRALATGATLAVPVTFTAAAAGAASGSLTLTTSAGQFSADLHAVATQPGLGAAPASLSFATVATGTTSSSTVSITNTGTTDETITAVTPPSGAFSATGLPAPGTVLHAQAGIAVSVTYAPTTTGSDTGSFTVTSTHGTLTVPLTGTAETGHGVLTLTPASTDAGDVVVGASRTVGFDVANTGNIPLTITLAKAPSGAFTAQNPLSEGVTLGPGDVVHQQVTFRPTALGAVTAEYVLNADTGQPALHEALTGRGVTGTALPPPTGAGWQRNGVAAVSGGDLVLTPATKAVAGSAFSTSTLPTEGLDARFTAAIGGGTGADGITFALLDASAPPSALGGTGGAIGFGGAGQGVAVTLDTYKSAQDPSANFVGVTDGLLPGRTDALHYLAASTAVGPLRVGTHAVEVAVRAGHLFVSVDGALRIDTPVTLPARVRPGFTAATGGADDRHVVRGVGVTSAQEGIDTAAPAVRITSPTAGARVSGTTTVTASAVDDHSGVAGVRFSLDGQPLGVTSTTAPYQLRWGTTRVANGRHTLAAVAIDAAGNTATAAPVTITVDNPLPVETSASADGRGNVTVSRFSTAHPGDVVLALVGAGGPAGKRQATSVTGGGLTWSLRGRANTVGGVAEVWQAVAPKALTKITITAKPVRAGYDTSLTVLALTGTRGVVRATGRSATTGLPSAALVTAAAGSWLVGAGEDPTAARAHTPASGQSLVHQWLDTRTRRTFWFQLASPDAAARATVRLSDVAPKTDAWNLVVVEVGRR